MKCIVLVKQVPDTTIKVKPDSSGSNLSKEGLTYVINPYDEYAIETALQLVAKFPGEITYISVGDLSVEDILRKALAMGGDNAIRIDVPEGIVIDNYAVSLLISSLLKNIEYDLILCGKQSAEDDASVVPSMVAEYLNIPQITFVKKIEPEADSITCYRDSDYCTEVLNVKYPALITADKGLVEPRTASVMGIMKAKKKTIDVKSFADLGLEDKREILLNLGITIKSLSEPVTAREKVKIEASDPAQGADEIIKFLKEKAKVI
jgi:electron transfer flavoprotein beta subunit